MSKRDLESFFFSLNARVAIVLATVVLQVILLTVSLRAWMAGQTSWLMSAALMSTVFLGLSLTTFHWKSRS